jgi:heterotetrameric sarcosine oxidase delta subunit
MLRIQCPFCGERDHSEFTYGGDATIAYPPLDAPLEAWIDAVYVRANPKGPHCERWHHSDGCRLWLVVERDTLTHEIRSVMPARAAIAALLREPAR